LFVTEALLLAAFGWFDGEITGDTATDQVLLTWPGAFAEMRYPLYAVFLTWLDPIESHLRTIAVLQMAFQFLHVLCCFGKRIAMVLAQRRALPWPYQHFLVNRSCYTGSSLIFLQRAVSIRPACSFCVPGAGFQFGGRAPKLGGRHKGTLAT